MKRTGLAVVVLGLMAAGRRADADLSVYVTADKSGGKTVLGTLDLSTGQYNQVATMTVTATSLTAGANGTIYASATTGHLYTLNTSTGATTQFGTITAPPGSGGIQEGFLGLAYAGANGFYGANLNGYVNSSTPMVLDQISSTASNVSALGSMGIPDSSFFSGGLTFGPDGNLYSTGENSSDVQSLFSVNLTTGLATQVGSGLGTLTGVGLGLVTVDGTLYGIDESQASRSGPYDIYTINVTTGAATSTGVAITGLGGYELDAAVYPTAVPEPTSLALCGIAATVALTVRLIRGRLAA